MNTVALECQVMRTLETEDVCALEVLIKAGFDPSCPMRSRKNTNWIFQVAEQGCAEQVELMLSHGADVLARNKEGQTALFVANAKNIKALIKGGLDVNHTTPSGVTALLSVVQAPIYWDSHLLRVSALIGVGADPNCSDDKGDTPLHVIACGGSNRQGALMADKLIEAGAEVNRRNLSGQTALNLTLIKSRNLDFMLTLLNHGAAFDPNSQQAEYAARFAAALDNTELLMALSVRGLDLVRTRFKDGTSLLHSAFENDASVAALFLMEQGLSPELVKDRDEKISFLRHKSPKCWRLLHSFDVRLQARAAIEEIKKQATGVAP